MNGEKRTHPRAVETRGVESRGPEFGESFAVARSSISWRGIFAGAFVAMLSYLILMALGMAIGGGTLRGAIESEGGIGGFGIGTAIWLIAATIISLFIGGYAAGRVSGFVATKVGRTQGAVVASLFFVVLLMQAGTAIGMIGAGVGNVVGAVGGAVPGVAQNQQVQQTVQQALGDLDLQSPPEQVAQGIAVRLMQGDDQAAVSYLAEQAGISEQEAQQRLADLRTQVEGVLATAGETAARVVQAAGWALFLSFFLGALAAMAGGDWGARRNLSTPIDRHDERALRGGGRAA